MKEDSGPSEVKEETGSQRAPGVHRRKFLSTASNTAMAGGLIASYGTFGVMAGRFLYSNDKAVGLQYVATLDQLAVGESLTYTSPAGAEIVVARQNDEGTAEDFVALSSICPHLGCKVHWEAANDRFFCPCHNGAFDRSGQPTEGPPAAAGQQLTQFPLEVIEGLLYVEVPLKSVGTGESP